jgi:nickel-dependent lactate racemase
MISPAPRPAINFFLRFFWEAEVKIVTAPTAPHQAAGFSGGRKSVLPGIASLATLKQHHGFNLRSDKPAMGWVEGNKFHENALEAARMAKVDFILTTVQNQHKEITQVVAGDVEKAKIILMKNGSDMIPCFEGKPENA